MTPDVAPLGYPYLIGEAVMEALKADPAFAGVKLVDNPSKPEAISEGKRLLLFKDAADSLEDQNGNAMDRVFTFQVGAISRDKQSRKQAHTDYRALKRVIRDSIKDMTAKGARITGQVRETAVSYQLENLDVGGSLVLGTFTVKYRDPTF
ncbi:hypothetical protein FVQ98_14055 [Ottowia sp. GY511]|uniref:DUF3168 domain-containing protein n=1 Tax=Ottowia flava TaxID=2675430 RepID=A0ABW4KPY8_9BURK|nr:hypothetical protein [Ottowia sp. GY511]TXK26496.1 hypothetical protein FVQ98_14055 [Ottowia sp. GY511]